MTTFNQHFQGEGRMEDDTPMIMVGCTGTVSTISQPHKATVVKIIDPTRAIVVKIHYYATGRTQRLSVYGSEFQVH